MSLQKLSLDNYLADDQLSKEQILNLIELAKEIKKKSKKI